MLQKPAPQNLCIFLVSVVIPDCILTSKTSELESTKKRECVALIFLGLVFLTWYNIFQFHALLPAN